ncbi:phytanoyl-CoA dioxygenase family protein [bacterium]|nr:phytanoyl-CoA dioxygenase family protein [bacterium]
MRRITFKNKLLQKSFDENGYVVAPLLESNQLTALEKAYKRLDPGNSNGFHASILHNSVEYRRNVHRQVSELMIGAAEGYLDNYRALSGQFVVKEPGKRSFLPHHLDWSFIDETNQSSVAIWCPLKDVNHENGNLTVLEGSHNIGLTKRGFGYTHTEREVPDVLSQRFKEVAFPLKAGESLFYDHRLIHGSPPNLSSLARVVSLLILIPTEAQSLYYHRKSEKELEVYQTDEEFYFRYKMGEPKLGLKKLAEKKVSPNYISLEQLSFLKKS